ncbi:hypothetical protein BFINE_47570 [Bacteroides finegoldii DSM 17565]|nr:hypothetical protein BFINE_47570 [Bacteroides finegoldii DSM 17565]
MEEKDLWMNKLKEKLADYSEPVPASGWEQLEKELMPPVERRIYPYRRWMMVAAAVILLAVVSSVSLYFLGTPAADHIRNTQTPALASMPDALPGVQRPDVQGSSVEPVLRPVARENRLAKAAPAVSEHKAIGDEFAVEEVESVSEEVEPTVKEEAEKMEEKRSDMTQTENDDRSTVRRPRRPSGKDKYHIPAEKATSRKGTWSMGLSVGNSGGASTEVGTGINPYMSRVSMLSVSDGLMEIPNDQTLVFEGGVPYLLQKERRVVDIKHHQPISFGLSVRKALARGFSLETGLTYTLLSSDAKLANEEHQIEQKLHYVGIHCVPTGIFWIRNS